MDYSNCNDNESMEAIDHLDWDNEFMEAIDHLDWDSIVHINEQDPNR